MSLTEDLFLEASTSLHTIAAEFFGVITPDSGPWEYLYEIQ